MPTEISELPDYAPAQAKYTADLRQAETEGDQAKIDRVKFEWDKTQFDLRQKAADIDRNTTAVADAREQAKKEYPKVPESLYAHFTEPKAILAAAKQSAEAIEGAVREGTQSWGGNAPAGGAANTATGVPGSKTFDQVQNDLTPSVQRRDKAAIGQYMKNEFAARIGSRMVDPNKQEGAS